MEQIRALMRRALALANSTTHEDLSGSSALPGLSRALFSQVNVAGQESQAILVRLDSDLRASSPQVSTASAGMANTKLSWP